MKRKISVILIVAALLLFATGCEGGVPEQVDLYQPLGEDFLERLYALDFDGTYEQFTDEMKLNITRRRWEDEVYPQLYEAAGDMESVRFASAYGVAEGQKLWLHMRQKKEVIVYCFVFNGENKISNFTFRLGRPVTAS